MFGNAEAYERFMGRWSRLLAPTLVDFANIVNSGDVLDIGSGTGALAFSIAETKRDCKILGIEPSSEYVDFAESQNRFGERVSFESGNAQRLRFGDATFQACLSLLVFNFISDYKQALQEIARVTKPGGTVSAAVWDYGNGMQMLRIFWDAVATVDPSAERLDERHMPLCRSGELGELWRHTGFQHVEERGLTITTQFSSFADYWDPFLLGQGPAGAYAKHLDDRRRGILQAEIRRRLSVQREDVPFSMTATAWAVRGIVPNSI
jgi:SAM-dependent methyltransferase